MFLMLNLCMPTFGALAVALGATSACAAAPSPLDDLLGFPSDPGHWRLTASPWTGHFRYSVEHRHVFALGVERQRDDGWLGGAAMFRNSFGQPSGFVFLGQRIDTLFDEPSLFAQWQAGIIYGYVGRYKTKLPLNFAGFAPGVLVSAGWQLDPHVSVQAHLLGDAGVMLQLAWDFR